MKLSKDWVGNPPILHSETCLRCHQARFVYNGAFLRWLRERAGISLREMARRLKLSPAYLSDVERNRRGVTPDLHIAYDALRKKAS